MTQDAKQKNKTMLLSLGCVGTLVVGTLVLIGLVVAFGAGLYIGAVRGVKKGALIGAEVQGAADEEVIRGDPMGVARIKWSEAVVQKAIQEEISLGKAIKDSPPMP